MEKLKNGIKLIFSSPLIIVMAITIAVLYVAKYLPIGAGLLGKKKEDRPDASQELGSANKQADTLKAQYINNALEKSRSALNKMLGKG